MKTGDLKIGYLIVSSPVPNVFVGGLMVTDSRGLPVEFRYTEPIQPTKIQQVLYGQVLSRYIKREVILETLLKNIETKFKYLLVEDENLIEYAAKDYAIFRVSDTKSPPIGPIGKFQEIAPGEILLQLTAEGSPLRIYAGNVKTEDNSQAESRLPAETIEILVGAGESMDLAEPLARIEKALEIICQEAGITAVASQSR